MSLTIGHGRALSWRPRQPVLVPLAVLGAVVFVVGRMARHLPLLPVATGDSPAYLAQAMFRPPLYGWLLAAWQGATGGLAYLPHLQLVLLGCGVFAAALELGRLLRSPWLGAAAVPAVLLHPAVYDSDNWLLTEAPFLALVLAGAAGLLRHARRGGLAPLLVAAGCFGLATLTRSTGLAFLVLPVLAALCDRRRRLRTALVRAGASGLLGALVLAIGMGWGLVRYGHFELGSWAGISLLGKTLVMVRPADLPRLPAPVAAMAADAANARALIAAQPDLAARLRAQVQASGDVRFPVFWERAASDWPEWQQADGRGRDLLARRINRTLIAAHPFEYLAMWGRDWLALVIHPAYWPAGTTAVAANPEAFPACGRTGNCWALQRHDLPWYAALLLFGVSLGGAALSLALLAGLAWPVLRRRARPDAVLAFGLALVLHGTLLVTAAIEAGHIRYTVATHAIGVLLLARLAARWAPWLAAGPRP